MYCGLQHAKGEYVAIMDCDLQDPPDLLPQMFIWISKGYDQVATRRVTRDGEPIIRSWFARRFYSIMNKLSDTEIVDGARDFRLMTRKVVDNILKISEYNRFSKGMFSWVGFNTKWIEYENIERVKGTSKWNFWSLFRYAIEGIVGYTVKPLELPFIIGGIIDIFSVVTIIIVLILRFCCKFTGVFVSSTFIMILLVLLLFGVQMIVNGIFGEYLAKTYLEVKNRPIYIIDEDTNKE